MFLAISATRRSVLTYRTALTWQLGAHSNGPLRGGEGRGGGEGGGAHHAAVGALALTPRHHRLRSHTSCAEIIGGWIQNRMPKR